MIRFVARTYPPCWVLKARIQKHRGKPLLFHDKCPGFFYVHYTTHGTYSFTSHPKDEAIMVKCLAQGHKRRDRPGRDSNSHSGNTRTWVQCARPLGHNTHGPLRYLRTTAWGLPHWGCVSEPNQIPSLPVSPSYKLCIGIHLFSSKCLFPNSQHRLCQLCSQPDHDHKTQFIFFRGLISNFFSALTLNCVKLRLHTFPVKLLISGQGRGFHTHVRGIDTSNGALLDECMETLYLETESFVQVRVSCSHWALYFN